MSLFSTFQFAKLIVPYLSSDENAVSRHDGHYYKEMDRAAAGLECHSCPAGDLLRRQDARVTESLARQKWINSGCAAALDGLHDFWLMAVKATNRVPCPPPLPTLVFTPAF